MPDIHRPSAAATEGDGPVHDLPGMLAGLKPTLNDGAWVFETGPDLPDLSRAAMAFREHEGWTALRPGARDEVGAQAWITLGVWSSLDGVGLTAAVSAALAAEAIPANVVAAYHHDHVFTPIALADHAMETLTTLAETARAGHAIG